MALASHIREYDPAESVVFLKTKEQFGGLSNMAPGFPLKVNGARILTSEALYQACRFPHKPDLQHQIISERSPMTAKMRSKPFRKESRPDWYSVRVKVMRWCLRVKLAQNWREFSKLLLSTGEYPIVERSRSDDFWGARDTANGSLVGMNFLGRLLMELREDLRTHESDILRTVEPLSIPEFLLLRKPIEVLSDGKGIGRHQEFEPRQTSAIAESKVSEPYQSSLFDVPKRAQTGVEIRNPHRRLLNPYPSYRESGVQWLGRVPEHWKLLRGKFLFRAIDARSGTGQEELLTVSSEHGVVPRSSATVTMFKAETYVGHKLCWPGDLVINSLWAWGRGLGISQYYGIISSAYGVYRLRKRKIMYSAYVHKLVRSSPFNFELRVRSKGIWKSRLQLTDDAFLSAVFPVPPTMEQMAILRLLDNEERRIQRYIRAKKKLIALLGEQKQAIIHQALTGQVDVRTGQRFSAYKDSNVEWLGRVPDHWEVRRLKTFCSMKSGCAITAQAIESSGAYPVYGGNGLRGYTGNFTHDGKFVLIGRQGALCGNVHIAEGKFRASDHAVVAAVHSDYDLEWFYAALLAMNLNQYSIAAAQPGLSVERVLDLSLAVPPESEQADIARAIQKSTSTMDASIRLYASQIQLMLEYRTRLIADVVTGKLDVRDAAATLPEIQDFVDNDAFSSSNVDPVLEPREQTSERKGALA